MLRREKINNEMNAGGENVTKNSTATCGIDEKNTRDGEFDFIRLMVLM